MDRLPEDTFFAPSAHPFGRQPQANTGELIEALERALREVATLPRNLSPTVAFAHQVLADFERLNAVDRLSSISAYVAHKLGVSHEQLMSGIRSQRVAFCRHVAIYVCRSLSGASFPTLGAHFGRNHSTCVYACNLIERRMQRDAAFRHVIEQIERDLTHVTTITAAAA
jgi:chromosomal replication initiator protein